MRRRLQRWLPSEHRLRSSPSLRWLRPLLPEHLAWIAAVTLRQRRRRVRQRTDLPRQAR